MSNSNVIGVESYHAGNLIVHPDRNCLQMGEMQTRVEPVVMGILCTLAHNPGRVVLRETLLEQAWPDQFASDEQLTLAVSKLRRIFKKLDPDTTYIETIPKRGYRLVPPVTIEASMPDASKQPSIAVLAFADMSPDKDHEYFGDGVSEEIINALVKLPGLQVVARTSSFSFKGRNVNLREIGRTLNVSHILEGSVRVKDGKLRITSQLIQADNGYHLWSKTYDGDLSAVFDLQEDIASAISKELITHLDVDPPRLALKLTDSDAAYALFLQGRALNTRQYGDGVLKTATGFLQDAVALDPGFAEAHSELANSYSLASIYTRTGNPRKLVDMAAERAHIAIDLDPKLGFPLTLIALQAFSKGDIVGAIDLTERAYQLEPDNAEVVIRLGYFYAAIGRIQHAITLLERAVRADPIQGRNHQILGLARLSNGDYQEAEKLAKRAIDLHHYFAYDTYIAAAAAMGNYDLAAERLRGWGVLKDVFGEKFDDNDLWINMTSKAFSPDSEVRKNVGEWIFNLMYDPEKPAESLLLQALFRTGSAKKYFAAIGDTPPPGRHGSLLSIWGDTEPCRDIYTHPDFMAFANKIGFVKAWEKYGWPDRLQ